VPPAWLSKVPASDRWRAVTSSALLDGIVPALTEAGITRIAELTELDRVGMPVFQAIRPMSRALSVHQGKGPTEADARVSAAMEAIESSAAEAVEPVGHCAPFSTLPADSRASALSAYGPSRGGGIDDAAIEWLEGVNLGEGRPYFVPFDIVTLDLAAIQRTPFIRSSTGLAAGATLADATTAAAFELVERESQARWLAAGLVGQAHYKVRSDTIEIEWFRALVDHLGDIGLTLSVYALRGIGGLPVVICRIDEPGVAPSYAGAACRHDPADALLRAFGEAAQSRLTVISGARDDIAPDEPGRIGERAIGPPTGCAAKDWRCFADDAAAAPSVSPVDALVATGLDVARIELAAPIAGVGVVKLVVPGLPWSPEMLT